jgi:hypothetical protein
MQRVKIACTSVLVLLPCGTIASGIDFCDQKTTEVYHSPKCGLWVEEDPQRVNDINIPFNPPYHTYSRWIIDDQSYILAYRDVDYEPANIIVDFYSVDNKSKVKRGSVNLNGVVVNVLAAKLTGSKYHEIMFRHADGQLQYISIVKIRGNKIKKIFSYGATEIEIIKGLPTRILAKAESSNLVEEYIWVPTSGKFVKNREYPWNKK